MYTGDDDNPVRVPGTYQIFNVLDFELPLTGGSGMAGMMVNVGLAIVVAATGMLVTRSVKKKSRA